MLSAHVSLGPTQVAAIDNDDSRLPSCTIQINGKVAQNNQSVYPSRLDGTTKVYPIRVCGGSAFDQETAGQVSPNTCMRESGRPLRVSVKSGVILWEEFPLTKGADGCFTGEIRLGAGSSGSPWNLDVEMDGDSANICAVDMPACRRIRPVFESQTEEANEACEALENSFSSCEFLTISPERINVNTPATIAGTIPDLNSGSCPVGEVEFNTTYLGVQLPGTEESVRLGNPGLGQAFSQSYTPTLVGVYTILLRSSNAAMPGGGVNPSGRDVDCKKTFRVCLASDTECSAAVIVPPDEGADVAAFQLCSQVAGDVADKKTPKGQCDDCLRVKGGVWTAIGCIPAEPSSMIKSVITIGVGIGGGVALLMTLIGGFLLTTSQGNPKQQETAKEMITSAVIGLLFVMFSVVILQFVGVTILQIPGFGTLTEATP